MQFEVLGRVGARRDGVDVALGSYKQRSLVALLLVHANEVVATDRIIDELWGDQPAGDRQNALWVHVSNLRSALEPAREKRSEGTLLLTRSPGYLLQVGPDDLDAWMLAHRRQVMLSVLGCNVLAVCGAAWLAPASFHYDALQLVLVAGYFGALVLAAFAPRRGLVLAALWTLVGLYPLDLVVNVTGA